MDNIVTTHINYKKEYKRLKNENSEYKKVYKFHKERLNEINFLNVKLLFTCKLFKNFNLSNNEKQIIIDKFDNCQKVKDCKYLLTQIESEYKNNN